MRRVVLILLLVTAVAFQVSLLPTLRPLGIVPNLALVVMVLASLSVTTSEGLIAAVISGLVLDLASGANFGLWTGIMVLVVLVVGMLHRAGIELDRSWVPLALVAGATFVLTIGVWLGLVSGVSNWPVLNLIGRLTIELVINLGLTVALMPLVRWLLGGGARRSEVGGLE